MSRIILMLSASLLLLNGCGRTVSTVDSAYLKRSTSGTLADKNRYDLMASSHLETGIQYIAPTPQGTPQPKADKKSSTKAAPVTESSESETDEAESATEESSEE